MDLKRQSFSYDLLSSLHFNASVVLGWILFHKYIFPFFYLSKEFQKDLAFHLPIYAINVLAFGALVCMTTKPIFLLINHLGERFCEVLDHVVNR